MKIVSYCVHSKNIVLKEVMPEGLICLHDDGMTPTDKEDREKELVDIADFVNHLKYGKIEFSQGGRTRVLLMDECDLYINVGSMIVLCDDGHYAIDFVNGKICQHSIYGDEIKEDIDIKTLFIH